ncbi:hypothetical protein ACFQ02_00345 [Seminibacterium arietis]|uniref:Secreted protein n=1 Tax=Seminibacterium arietis TaxID=1173502 RepID=A0ABW3I679_9PAST
MNMKSEFYYCCAAIILGATLAVSCGTDPVKTAQQAEITNTDSLEDWYQSQGYSLEQLAELKAQAEQRWHEEQQPQTELAKGTH